MMNRRRGRTRNHRFAATVAGIALAVGSGCGGGSGPTASVATDPAPTSANQGTATSDVVSPPDTGTVEATETTETTATTTTADSNPIGDGEDQGVYRVGAATVVLDDPVRPLTVEVWFPLDPTLDTADRTAQRYALSPTVYLDSEVAVAATADDMVPDARFPLVVYSHGSGGLRYINATYSEAIASHGYVVVAADHTGNTAVDTLAGNDMPATIFADRVNDVDRMIDAFTETDGESSAAAFAAGVDPDLIAVTGHSFGGWTAIASAVGSDDPPATTEGDPRIDAIIPIAPAVSGLLTPERLATLAVPMLVISGTEDASTPVTPHTDDLWNETSDTPAYRVDIDGAEHQSFTDVCIYQDELAKLPDVPDAVTETLDGYAASGCEPGDLPWEQAHEIAVTYSIGFLDEVLKGDAGAMPRTAPDGAAVTSR